MGWLGFGVLVASVSYLIYRHLPTYPSSFPSCFSARSRDARNTDNATDQKENEKLPHGTSGLDTARIRSQIASHGACDSIPPVTLNLPGTDDSVDRISPSIVATKPDEQSRGPISQEAKNEGFSLDAQSRSPYSFQPTQSHASMLPPPPRLKPPTFGAPPRPINSAPLRPPPSAASSLRVPVTKHLPNSSLAPSQANASKPSRQVVLAPGHSPLDWAMLASSPNHKLRGANMPAHYIRVPPSLLKHQNGRKGRDAWTVWQGKVYNITPYLPFHPGGEGELMRAAGKEAGKLFMEVHPWVNWDGMLSECLVGILVSEGEEKSKGTELDDMD